MGRFNSGGLVTGRYVLEITATGFSRFTQELTLAAGAMNVDATLQIAPLAEDVTVQGEAAAPRRRREWTCRFATSPSPSTPSNPRSFVSRASTIWSPR